MPFTGSETFAVLQFTDVVAELARKMIYNRKGRAHTMTAPQKCKDTSR